MSSATCARRGVEATIQERDDNYVLWVKERGERNQIVKACEDERDAAVAKLKALKDDLATVGRVARVVLVSGDEEEGER